MTTEQPPTFREVGVEEARQLRDAGYRVIDVRERVEWDEGHVPGATHIPLAEVASRLAYPNERRVVATARDVLAGRA